MNRIVICGSGKLREEIFLAGQRLSDAGLQVMVPPLHRIEETEVARTVLLDRVLNTTDVEEACKKLTGMVKGAVVA